MRLNNKWFLIVSVIVFTLILVISVINDRFQADDFGVYFYASKAMLTGEKIYNTAFGASMTGFYKYAPSVLFLYIPANLLGFKMAAVINYALQAIFAILSVFISAKIITTYFIRKATITNVTLFLVFFLSLTFINRDILLGNVNGFLLFTICLSLILVLNEHYKSAGFLLALVVVFKPYLLLVTLPMLRKERIRVFYSFGVSLITFSILPFFYFGIGEGFQIYKDWITALMKHDSYIISPFTFNSLISRYLFNGNAVNLTYYILGIVLLLYILRSVYLFVKQHRQALSAEDRQVFLFESLILLALVPNLVNTDLQQFVYSMPLVAFIVIYLLDKKKISLTIAAILIFFFYTIDQPDILGRSFAMKVHECGFRGLSNLGIIIFAWSVYLISKRNRQLETI